jgi:hypothetical protein
VKIFQLVTIKKFTLVTYYTSKNCYQFCLLDPEGVHYSFDEIFYTAYAAEQEGRKAINAALSI